MSCSGVERGECAAEIWQRQQILRHSESSGACAEILLFYWIATIGKELACFANQNADGLREMIGRNWIPF